ncbi:MAG: sigma-70 family RNA polymerase sigma factor [Planctomycetaceae bacterium]
MSTEVPPDDPLPDSAGSMSLLLQDWSANEERIAEKIAVEYFPRLRRFSQRVLGLLPGAATEADDVVQSAIKSLCLFMRRQSDACDKDRDYIWRLLCHIAARKASRRRLRQTRGLRNGRLHPISDLATDGSFSVEDALEHVSPAEFDLMIQDVVANLDKSLQIIALLVMEGKTQSEISDILGCSRRTVIRKFDMIKRLLQTALE